MEIARLLTTFFILIITFPFYCVMNLMKSIVKGSINLIVWYWPDFLSEDMNDDENQQ
jgi:hypothetical protein